jgi:hypothetical protein
MKPLWIVQNNLGSTGNYEAMQAYAQVANIPFLGVKIRPFTDDVPDDNTSGPVVVYGSCGMVRAARKTRLARGIFDNAWGFSTPTWIKHYGTHMLNHDAILFHADAITEGEIFLNNKLFVRGNDDEKTITGHITTGRQLKEDLINRNIAPDYTIVVSRPRDIYREYRCWCVDGKIISASQYGNNYRWSSKMTLNDAVDFASEMVKLFQPHRIFVIDVCDSEDGAKIVELNGFNSAGFYQADIPAIMDAVNKSILGA